MVCLFLCSLRCSCLNAIRYFFRNAREESLRPNFARGQKNAKIYGVLHVCLSINSPFHPSPVSPQSVAHVNILDFQSPCIIGEKTVCTLLLPTMHQHEVEGVRPKYSACLLTGGWPSILCSIPLVLAWCSSPRYVQARTTGMHYVEESASNADLKSSPSLFIFSSQEVARNLQRLRTSPIDIVT